MYKIFRNENGRLHREDGPAKEWFGKFYVSKGKFKHTEWYVNGKRHRLDGPAVECPTNNVIEWWINGKRINCNSQEEFNRLIKLKAFW